MSAGNVHVTRANAVQRLFLTKRRNSGDAETCVLSFRRHDLGYQDYFIMGGDMISGAKTILSWVAKESQQGGRFRRHQLPLPGCSNAQAIDVS